jgi:hypothetical protein
MNNNKQGGGWTDLQTVTHFRNALRGEMLMWCNSSPLDTFNQLNVSNNFNKTSIQLLLFHQSSRNDQKSDKKSNNRQFNMLVDVQKLYWSLKQRQMFTKSICCCNSMLLKLQHTMELMKHYISELPF